MGRPSHAPMTPNFQGTGLPNYRAPRTPPDATPGTSGAPLSQDSYGRRSMPAPMMDDGVTMGFKLIEDSVSVAASPQTYSNLDPPRAKLNCGFLYAVSPPPVPRFQCCRRDD